MLAAPHCLTPPARQIIQNPDHTIFVSAITAVKIAIKCSLGKLDAPAHLSSEITARGLIELPLHYAHGEALQNLPHHHQDPFDRILIAQALHEQLTLITHDQKFASYGLPILWT